MLDTPVVIEPEIWPYYERGLYQTEPWVSDFQGLQWLYIDGSPVVIGYRGRLYSVFLNKEEESHVIEWGTPFPFSINGVYLRINDYAGNSAVACSQVHSTNPSSILRELKGCIVKFIIQQGQESTDFYK